MLQTRIVAALIALPLVAAAIFAGGYWFLGGVLVIGLLNGWEFGQMMQAGGYRPSRPLMLLLIAALMLDAYFPTLRLLGPILSVALLSSLIWQLFQTDSRAPTADWALTLAGGFYIGWGMAHLVALRELSQGLAWLLLALVSIWAADTMAYFVGRTFGRRRLWPRHSPKKTWEGLGGGVAGGILGAVGVSLFFPQLSWSSALIIGAVVPIIGLFGDLAESMMKRHVGVKDSSNLFPGHGGFLDRSDSVLFVSIVVYYYAIWVG